MSKSCQAIHPESGVQCARSDWPGHADLPHVWYRDRRSMEAETPTITWEDAEHRRPQIERSSQPVRLAVLDDLMKGLGRQSVAVTPVVQDQT